MVIYEPREDSYLLAKHAAQHAKGTVLDVGTGSGIQAIVAAKSSKVKNVLAIDIQKSVINHCKEKIKSRKISFKQSNLFENVSAKFDTIIFNPPYLPEDVKSRDITLDGGKKGYETLERFFDKVNEHLKQDGIIILLFSSLTNKRKVEEFIDNHLLEHKELEKQNLFMEQLYVYNIVKSDLLKKLEKRKIEKKNITNIKRLTKGHRGIIITGMLGKKKIAVKIQRTDIGAIGTVDLEAKVLKILNKHKIGPKLLFSSKDMFCYEFVEGVFIPEFLENAGKKDIQKVLINVFTQCYKLDKLGFNKEEMHHPYKHVVVSKKSNQIKTTLLDFERARRSENVHNVTQFCQYVASGNFRNLVKGKISINESNMRDLAKKYKEDINLKNFKDILKEIN